MSSRKRPYDKKIDGDRLRERNVFFSVFISDKINVQVFTVLVQWEVSLKC